MVLRFLLKTTNMQIRCRSSPSNIRPTTGHISYASRILLQDARSDYVEPAGTDVGSQYRSGIFYHDQEQEKIAKDVTAKVNEQWWKNGVVTEILPAGKWWDAETYHQLYLDNSESFKSIYWYHLLIELQIHQATSALPISCENSHLCLNESSNIQLIWAMHSF